MKQNINYTYLENICLHCRVSDRGTPIRVLLRATEIVYKQLVIGPGRKMMTLL